MSSAFALVIILLIAALQNNSSASVVDSFSKSHDYIKYKLRNVKELLAKSYSSAYSSDKNIAIANNHNSSWRDLYVKNLDASTRNVNDKRNFVECVRKLENLLDYRMKMNMKKDWLRLRKIYLDRENVTRGSAASFEVREDIALSSTINPVKLKNLSTSSLADIATLNLLEKYVFFKNERGYFLSGDIALNGAINFQEISMSNLRVDYLGDKKAVKLLISGTDQSFSTELRQLRNLIKNLEVSAICGLPFEYWQRINYDTSEISLNNIDLNICSIYNETVISIDRDVYYVNKINVNKINGIDINNLVSSSFLLREIQVIQGNLTSANPLRGVDLRAKIVNNVSSSKLLNKIKNESIDHEIAIDRFEVQHLWVDKINEVTVSDAARMSEENVIKGKVRIGNLLITDEVKVKENIAVPLTNPMQVYEEILIDGDVFVKNVQIESESCIMIGATSEENNRSESTKEVSCNELLEQSWRKSEEQTILQNVRFKKGAAINELVCRRLNGLRDRDFVYSASDTLQMENVTFANVHSTEQLFVNENRSDATAARDRTAGGFLKRQSPEMIEFNTLIRFYHLSVDKIVLDNYSGIPVDYIMSISASNSLKLSETSQMFSDSTLDGDFQILRVTDQMLILHLKINWLNSRNASSFESAVRSDKHLKVDRLGENAKLNVINVKDVKIKNLRGKNVERGLLKQEIFIKNSRENLTAVTVAERLEVENRLSVIDRKFNEEDVERYIGRIKSFHLNDVIEMDLKRIDRLVVFKHLNASNYLKKRLEDVFTEAVSINRKQAASSLELTADYVKIDYLSSERLNKLNASSLLFTDTPSLINENKYFSLLHVEGNIKTRRLNNESVTTAKMTEQLQLSGAMLNNESVHIFGFVFWEDYPSSFDSESIKELFDYAVSRADDQSIDCPLVVEEATAVDSLEVANKTSSPVLNKIFETLSDCLINSEDSIMSPASVVAGKKVLKKKVEAHDVTVLKDIKLQRINHAPFDQMMAQIFRKSENETALRRLSFLDEVHIGSLSTQKNGNNELNPHKFALIDKRIMPSRLAFNHLIIERNVSLHKLDDIQFDDFVMKRLNIADPYDIFVDVQFRQSIAVLTGSSMMMINGIRDKHFVLKFVEATVLPTAPASPILIKGKKTFSSPLRIERNLDLTSLTLDFNDSLTNDNNIEIFGDLVIEDDVESSKDIILLGQGKFNTGLIGRETEIEKLNKILMRARAIDQLAATRKDKLGKSYFYLEKMSNFDIGRMAAVQAITNSAINHSSTRLDVYFSEPGTFCGLPVDCPCRSHLLLEISSSGNSKVIQTKRSNVLFNFYEPRGLLGLTVLSELGGLETGLETDTAAIFWTKLNAYGESKIEKLALRVEGFIADAQVFLINNEKLYMVLAIFYDNKLQSYATDSLLYEFDLESKQVKKCQSIETEGAKKVHVFQIAKSGVYALIGCIKGKAESLLLRFDPTTRQFQLVRTFTTGGSKHIASVSKESKSFIMLSNPDIEAVQIYIYNVAFDNFYDYQNLYFQSRVSSLGAFYSEDFGEGKAYFTVTTRDGLFYIYQYMLSGKFKMKTSYRIEDCQAILPFRIGNQNYLLAAHRLNSTIFKVVQDNN